MTPVEREPAYYMSWSSVIGKGWWAEASVQTDGWGGDFELLVRFKVSAIGDGRTQMATAIFEHVVGGSVDPDLVEPVAARLVGVRWTRAELTAQLERGAQESLL